MYDYLSPVAPDATLVRCCRDDFGRGHKVSRVPVVHEREKDEKDERGDETRGEGDQRGHIIPCRCLIDDGVVENVSCVHQHHHCGW